MNHFQQNLAHLQQHRPEILPLLKAQPCPPPSFTNEQEALALPEVLNSFTAESEDLLFLVGLGLGAEAKAITTRFPLIRLIIFEPNQDIFSRAMQVADQTALVTNTRVSLYVGTEVNIPEILQQEDDCLRALPFHLVINKHLQAILPDLYNPIYNTLQTALLSFKAKVQTIVKQGPLLLKNTVANATLLSNIINIQALADIALDLPIICVAAGPSLSANMELLRGQERHFFIIAVDSAAKVLIDHNIIPHLIVTIDPIPASFQKLKAVIHTHPDIPIALTPEAYPPTINGFSKSPKFIIPGINDLFRLYFSPLLQESKVFPSMVSVTHAATQIANVLGANRLIFIGLDLALHADKDHVEGCPVSWEEFGPDDRITVPAWNGGEVETVAVLQNQLTALQEIITNQPQLEYIDATEGGALIQGTKVIPLKAALELYKPAAEQDFSTRIHSSYTTTEKPDIKRVQNSFKKLKKDLKQSLKIANAGLKGGKEGRINWKLSKIPKKRSQALKKFRKSIIISGKNFDKMMDLLDLTNALYPLRAHDHHQFIYARKIFNETVETKTEEDKIFDELEQNMAYFKSWINTVKEAEKIIAEAERNFQK